jgi:SAM-dependent methyltransferase
MIRPLPFADGLFDVCFCVSVLEHLKPAGRREMASCMGRALRPGGIMALTFDWIRRRGPYPQGLRFRDREAIMRDVVRPSGCEILGNADWVDDEGADISCGALFLRKPEAPGARTRAERGRALTKVAAFCGMVSAAALKRRFPSKPRRVSVRADGTPSGGTRRESGARAPRP